MKYCKIPIFLAYILLIYIFTSIYYLIVTRKYGTPFKNAVDNYPHLVKIKNESANKRRVSFYKGIFISSIVIYLLKPFKKC
tara:strand:+ start:130 stop:372 length:243 start_codon:yes stop_codon:yes gene_type:complete